MRVRAGFGFAGGKSGANGVGGDVLQTHGGVVHVVGAESGLLDEVGLPETMTADDRCGGATAAICEHERCTVAHDLAMPKRGPEAESE